MTQKKINHVHRYKRVNLARNPGKEYLVLRCTKPTCSHYVPVELALGKMCECNRCEQVMILDKVSVNLALPHCLACTKRKETNAEAVDAIAAFLKETGN
jgi:hypothetical protein